jgi:RES domain-containing protein
MKVFRITGTKYANDLSGYGAALAGGRWNKKGSRVVYTGESKEIALLETIVHTPPMLIPKLSVVTLDIPENSITGITPSQLPDNWYDYPAPAILAEIGESWITENSSLVLKVPSSIIHTANNYILNCLHKDFEKVEIVEIKDFYFDTRLKK